MLDQTEVRKLLLEHFICWSEEMPTLSITDCGLDEDSQSFTFAVKFHRFVFNYQFPVDAITKENIQQVFHSAVVSLERTIAEAYYQHNYDLVFSHNFGQRKVLSQDTPGCRFCGKVKPERKFKKDAHAIPQSIGNKNLLTRYECDACNANFGNGIENDFGNFTSAARAFFGVPGDGGVPKFQGKDKDGHIFVNGAQTEIRISANSGKVTTDFNPLEQTEPPSEIKVTLTLPRFHPVAVLKAYYKMMVSVVPEVELEGLDKKIFQWLADADHTYLFPGMFTYLLESFHPVAQFNNGQVHVFRRKRGVTNVPYVTLVITFGQFVHQIFVSHRAEDGPHSAVVVPHYRCLPQCIGNEEGGRLFDLSTTKITGILIEPTDKFAFELVAKSEQSTDDG